MPSPVISMDISPDDETLAIGMTSIMAIYKRAPVKNEIGRVLFISNSFLQNLILIRIVEDFASRFMVKLKHKITYSLKSLLILV